MGLFHEALDAVVTVAMAAALLSKAETQLVVLSGTLSQPLTVFRVFPPATGFRTSTSALIETCWHR